MEYHADKSVEEVELKLTLMDTFHKAMERELCEGVVIRRGEAGPLCTSGRQNGHELRCEGGDERSWKERKKEGESRRRKLRPEGKIRGLVWD